MNDDCTRSSKELLPCPFCGGDKAVADQDVFGEWSVYCPTVGGCGMGTGHSPLKAVVVSAWNKRAAHEPCERLRDVLKQHALQAGVIDSILRHYSAPPPGEVPQPQPCRLCGIKLDRPDEAHDCVSGTLGDSQELRDARFAIGALIAAAGGRVVIMPSVLVNLDPRSETETFDDPVSGARIFSLRTPPTKAGSSQPTSQQVGRDLPTDETSACLHDWRPVICSDDEKMDQCVKCGDLRDGVSERGAT